MLSIIRNTLVSRAEREAAQSEVNPDLYLERAASSFIGAVTECIGLFAVGIMATAAFLFWLAYEGWITPDMFK